MPTPKQPKLSQAKPKRASKNDDKPLEGVDTTANKDLKKISLHVNSFGQIVSDIKTDDINSFLDEHVPDKKFDEL